MRRSSLVVGVAIVALPGLVVLRAPLERALVAPAAACTGMPQLAGMPTASAPLNVRVVVWQGESSLGTSPPDKDLILAQVDGGSPVEVTLASFGPFVRTDVVPTSPLMPETEYEVFWNFGSGSRVNVTRFRTKKESDTRPPRLVRVGTPELKSAKGLVSSCSHNAWTEIPITIEDDSPVVVAIWEAKGKAPDLGQAPLEYARPGRGRVFVQGHARLHRPDPSEPIDAHPGQGRRYALMAIDAAGNASDVVFTPGGKRAPSVAIAPNAAPTADASAPSPPPDAPSAAPSPGTDAGAPVAAAPPRSGGCAGCNTARADQSTLALVLLVAALLLLRKRHAA